MFASWKTFLPPSTIADSFAGYNSLGHQLWYFRTWSIFFQDNLGFKVFIVDSAVILICFSLYVTHLYSLTAFSTLNIWCNTCDIPWFLNFFFLQPMCTDSEIATLSDSHSRLSIPTSTNNPENTPPGMLTRECDGEKS